MAFLPDEFEVPPGFEAEDLIVRHLTIHDAVKDFDAVMTNRDELWEKFGECWGWPPEDLTLEQDLIDVAWHQKEGQLGRAFTYAIMSADEDRLLGCVYIAPATSEQFDAEVNMWVRVDDVEEGFDEDMLTAIKEWLTDEWPFKSIAWPGREIAWADYEG